MARRGEVLVAIMNNRQDMAIAHKQHWYRIPVVSVERRLKHFWPPEWIAWYQTKAFGEEAYSINYCAQILDIQKCYRFELFPDEAENENSQKQYYKLELTALEKLSSSIVSQRQRRITFIPTTLVKLQSAIEVKDLR